MEKAEMTILDGSASAPFDFDVEESGEVGLPFQPEMDRDSHYSEPEADDEDADRSGANTNAIGGSGRLQKASAKSTPLPNRIEVRKTDRSSHRHRDEAIVRGMESIASSMRRDGDIESLKSEVKSELAEVKQQLQNMNHMMMQFMMKLMPNHSVQ
jgi:hypothetical protein